MIFFLLFLLLCLFFYSTFANELAPTSNWLEVIFSILIVLSGLLLFTLLIGNIQVTICNIIIIIIISFSSLDSAICSFFFFNLRSEN